MDNLFKDINEAIESLEMEIVNKQAELDELINEYQKICGNIDLDTEN